MRAALLLSVAMLAAAVAAQDDGCCRDHPNKPAAYASFDCDTITPFGADRCKQVHGGGVCVWATGDECLPPPPPQRCTRVSHFEVFGDIKVDVGRCTGPCRQDPATGDDSQKCEPATWGTTQLSDGTLVRVIKECECSGCRADGGYTAIEVPAGKCEGRCDDAPGPVDCLAGNIDNFDTSDGLEPSSPSVALLSGILSGCSAGVQPGFDTFADNRCFGHTFEQCLVRRPACPLRSATLEICMQAANVFLTNTDSLILGVGGTSLWSRGLPALNGGTWNRGERLCLTLDLDALPTGGGGTVSILSTLESVAQLDVAVQDDTAVDFVRLRADYENCLRCLPSEVTVGTLYSADGVQHVEDVRDCDCSPTADCDRLPLYKTFFPGTKYERTIDVGQCAGDCPSKRFCRPRAIGRELIKAPEGTETVNIIKSCGCRGLVIDYNTGDVSLDDGGQPEPKPSQPNKPNRP